jgi:hypothetical protein
LLILISASPVFTKKCFATNKMMTKQSTMTRNMIVLVQMVSELTESSIADEFMMLSGG